MRKTRSTNGPAEHFCRTHHAEIVMTRTTSPGPGRSGILADGNNGFYYQTIDSAIHHEGDLMRVLDVLAKDVGILGVFSDWAAPVTYYANCMGLK
jgi:hypothetical protein